MIASVTLNPAVDYTIDVQEPLVDGAVSRSGDHRYDAGGKGINVSKYLVELDTDTVATGVTGGFLGEYLREQLSIQDIPADFVGIDGETRLNTTIHGPDGEYKINQNGPHVPALAIEDITEQLREYDPETVVIAGSLPPGTSSKTIDLLAAAGSWETVVDVGGDTLSALEAEYALCKPNTEELVAATGREIDSVETALAAAQELREHGFERVVASLGGDGAVMATPDQKLHAPAAAVDVVDTVGAGDALLSGVLSARARGESDIQALQTGVAVATRVVSVSGTQTPSFTDIHTDRESVTVSVY